MVLQKLKSVRPSSVCCISGKILYPSSKQWLEDIPFDQQRARKNIPQNSQVIIATQKCEQQIIKIKHSHQHAENVIVDTRKEKP